MRKRSSNLLGKLSCSCFYALASTALISSCVKPGLAPQGMSEFKGPLIAGSETVLIHSNDVLGEIEPCGCRNNPTGGLVRKTGFMADRPPAFEIQVDAGDLLFGDIVIPPLLVPQSELQARYLLQGMKRLGPTVVTPGEKDFALGTAKFIELTSSSGVNVIAANLVKSDGSAFLPATWIVNPPNETGKIGFIGVVGADLKWPDDLKVTDPTVAVRREVDRLRSSVRWVVLISHLGLDADRALALSMKGIDVIIGAHTQSFLQTPIEENGTMIYQTSFRSQYTGAITLPKGQGTPGYSMLPLDPRYETIPSGDVAWNDYWRTTQSEIKNLVAKFKEEVAKLNSSRDGSQGITNSSRPEENGQAGAPGALNGSQSGPLGPGSNGVAPKRYQTFVECISCHRTQTNFWLGTRHARALDPLVQAKSARNLECVACHSVGLGESGGFSKVDQVATVELDKQSSGVATVDVGPEDLASFMKEMRARVDRKSKTSKKYISDIEMLRFTHFKHGPLELKRAYAPVQCENCHGPAEGHPFQVGYTKTVDNSRCLTCHTQARAPDWYRTVRGRGGEWVPDLAKIALKRKAVACPRSR